jgi:Diaminopimelate decarboxylase
MKANSNLAILQLLAEEGAGFDIVSIEELDRVLKAGGDPNKMVFSGDGKQAHEIHRALKVGVHCFNVDSLAELDQLNRIAGDMQCIAPVSLPINPDVDPKTHPYISTGLKANKFGIAHDDTLASYAEVDALPHLKAVGIDCHIGSQMTDTGPLLKALDKLLELIDQLDEAGIQLEHIDLGGGLRVPYHDEEPPHPREYLQAVEHCLPR